MKLKKIVSFLLTAAFSLGVMAVFSACGGPKDPLQFDFIRGSDNSIVAYYVYFDKSRLDDSSITEIEIPAEDAGKPVTEICDQAFQGAKYLEKITLPASLQKIGEGAFNGCTALKSIAIPESVTSVGMACFEGCTALATVTLPNTTTLFVDSTAFDGTAVYSAAENWSDGAFYIGKHLIASNSDAKKAVAVREGTIQIMSLAFYGKSEITSVSFPSSLKKIGGNAFGKCPALKSVTFASGKWYYEKNTNGGKVKEYVPSDPEEAAAVVREGYTLLCE